MAGISKSDFVAYCIGIFKIVEQAIAIGVSRELDHDGNSCGGSLIGHRDERRATAGTRHQTGLGLGISQESPSFNFFIE